MKKQSIKIAATLLIIAVAAMVGQSLLRTESSVSYVYYTPSSYHAQVAQGTVDKSKPLRMGGVVKPESVYRMKQGKVGFVMADAEGEIHAIYQGEVTAGQEVVAEGMVDAVGVLQASAMRPKI